MAATCRVIVAPTNSRAREVGCLRLTKKEGSRSSERNVTSTRSVLAAASKGGAGQTMDKKKSEGLVDRLLRNAASLLHISDRTNATCLKCRGQGKIVCPVCKGSTTHGVHAVGGLKTNRCLTCHGQGFCSCDACAGKGRRL